MKCPRCATETAVQQVREIPVDACSSCSGAFLDHGELNRVAEGTDGDLEYSTVHEKDSDYPDSLGPIDCPRCEHGTMQKVEFLVYTGIVLDYCQGCSGFWLDGKELERINEYVREMNESSMERGSPAMEWFAQFLYSLPR